MRSIYREFLSLLPKHCKIVDLGGGSGRDTPYFLKQGYQVTAVDGSAEMVKLSSELTGQSTFLMTFDELNYDNYFDGVWACASLLHVPRTKISTILSLIINALKFQGILYLSFKYGTEERIEANRFFCDYNEQLLADLLTDLDIINI
ncbi:class I SAM-dependent methyltransferase [Cyanobacterium aponinum]|nr:class I SAM-dependent methyltransferase [Cyanobacterium aponinum]